METEELNFLKGELKKINDQIEKLQYDVGVINYQAKLWELRDKIKGEISELTHVSEKGKVS
mgnify:CR=1 FL=1